MASAPSETRSETRKWLDDAGEKYMTRARKEAEEQDAAKRAKNAEAMPSVHARWALAEKLIDAISDVGGVVAGEYVRNYVAYKAAQEGQGVWKGKRLTEVAVPDVVPIWACYQDMDDIRQAIKDLNVGVTEAVNGGDDCGYYFTVTLIDIDGCRLALQNMLPDFVDSEKIVESCNFLPANGDNPEVKLSFRMFDCYSDMRTFEGRPEEVDWECNALCIYERVIQPTFGQLSPFENMQLVTRVCGDILAGETKWIGSEALARAHYDESRSAHDQAPSINTKSVMGWEWMVNGQTAAEWSDNYYCCDSTLYGFGG